jgi:hypothetical protein
MIDLNYIVNIITTTKVGAVLSSIAGVLCMAIIWKPMAFKGFKVYELLSALIVYGSVGGFFLVGAMTDHIGKRNDPDYTLASGFVIGILIVGIANLIAAFFRKMESEGKDISDVIQEVKDLKGK